MLKIIFLMLFFKPRMKGKKLFIEKKTEKKEEEEERKPYTKYKQIQYPRSSKNVYFLLVSIVLVSM